MSQGILSDTELIPSGNFTDSTFLYEFRLYLHYKAIVTLFSQQKFYYNISELQILWFYSLL